MAVLSENLGRTALHWREQPVPAGELVEAVDVATGVLDWSGPTPRVFADAVADVQDGKFYVSATLVRRVLRQTRPAPADVRPWGPPGALLTP